MSRSTKRAREILIIRPEGGVGAYGGVWLSAETQVGLESLRKRNDQTSVREARTIDRHLDRFRSLGPAGLDNDKMFKMLGRFAADDTGTQVQVFEFKAYQWRLYGICTTVEGKRAFVGLAVDPSKKKDKADQALLKRCGRLAGCELKVEERKKDDRD